LAILTDSRRNADHGKKIRFGLVLDPRLGGPGISEALDEPGGLPETSGRSCATHRAVATPQRTTSLSIW